MKINRFVIVSSLLLCGSINLLSMDADMAGEALFNAAHRNNLADVQAAIAAGVDVNWRDNFGNTALLWAAVINNNLAMVQALIDAGANVNIQNNRGGDTVLILMIPKIDYNPADADNLEGVDDLEIVQFLINAGADLNIRNNRERTALMEARRIGLLSLQNFIQAIINADRLHELDHGNDLQEIYDQFDAIANKTPEQIAILQALNSYFEQSSQILK